MCRESYGFGNLIMDIIKFSIFVFTCTFLIVGVVWIIYTIVEYTIIGVKLLINYIQRKRGLS